MASNEQTESESTTNGESEPAFDKTKMLKQFGASVFFGVTSCVIVLVNKIVLTSYKFPSFQTVGVGQILAILLVAQVLKLSGKITFPDTSVEQVKKVFPLPIFYILNLLFGLGSTQKLSIPMFTVLRRFTLIFVSIGQVIILNKRESPLINATLVLMILGAFIAALNDLAFDITGYTFVLINDLASAANNLYIKKKTSADMGSVEILFYNALMVVVPVVLIAVATGELQKALDYPNWSDPLFILSFCLSCFMGFILMYSSILCTQLTSALTMVVVGCIKNIITTYIGMFVGGDYVYSPTNFIGINVSVLGSLIYSVIKYRENKARTESATNRGTVQQA